MKHPSGKHKFETDYSAFTGLYFHTVMPDWEVPAIRSKKQNAKLQEEKQDAADGRRMQECFLKTMPAKKKLPKQPCYSAIGRSESRVNGKRKGQLFLRHEPRSDLSAIQIFSRNFYGYTHAETGNDLCGAEG
jgi:hypothetical protein